MKTEAANFCVYKPSKAKTGAVLQLNPGPDYSCAFLEIASQSKNDSGGDKSKEFDYTNKIVMKLNTNDMLALIDILELTRTAKYKELIRCYGEDFDKWMADMASANKGNLVSLFHFNEKQGTNSILNIKPNSHKYGGGFSLQVSKQLSKDNTTSHRINLNTTETLGVLYTLERCIFLNTSRKSKFIPADPAGEVTRA